MKNRKNNIVKIIIAILILILLLLLLFSEKIINLNKKDINLAENGVQDEVYEHEANIPILSAGMIPIKYER